MTLEQALSLQTLCAWGRVYGGVDPRRGTEKRDDRVPVLWMGRRGKNTALSQRSTLRHGQEPTWCRTQGGLKLNRDRGVQSQFKAKRQRVQRPRLIEGEGFTWRGFGVFMAKGGLEAPCRQIEAARRMTQWRGKRAKQHVCPSARRASKNLLNIRFPG